MAFMNVMSGIAFILSNGMAVYGFPDGFRILGQGYLWMIPIPVIIMVVMFLLGGFILNKTTFGRYVYAIGGNEEAAKLSGVNVHNVKLLVYTLCGFFAGIAGLIMLSRLGSGQPTSGMGFEFQVITAVILGGTSVSGGEGKISRVVIGVLIMGVLSNGLLLLNVNTYAQLVINGLVLLVAVGSGLPLEKHRHSATKKLMEASLPIINKRSTNMGIVTATTNVKEPTSVLDRFTLKSKKALVTAAAGGIGRATSMAFAELGADVAIVDISAKQDTTQKTALEIAQKYSVKTISIAADVSDKVSVDRMVQQR